VADAVAAAGAGAVAEQDDLRLRQLDAGGARGDRGVEIEVPADFLRLRHGDFAQRDRDAERRGAVRYAIDSCTSQAAVLPRFSASSTDSMVRSGVLVCT